MEDKTDKMRDMQNEIFFRKSQTERFLIGADLIDFGYRLLLDGIRKKHPELSENEIKILMIRQCYKDQFSEIELEKIAESMRLHPQ